MKVFNKLKAYRDNIREYCYTDISRAFMIHAEEKYGKENPWLNCKIFNVEMPADDQGIETGGYDIAIATNVLHATGNIRRTLRNVKSVLKNNGVMVLNEISGKSLFTHLTFGLLEGWWLYEDESLRIPGCPGLYPETWQRVLEDEGFSFLLFPVKESRDLGQQIIAAQSNGVVRKKQMTGKSLKTAGKHDGTGAVKPVAVGRNLQPGIIKHGEASNIREAKTGSEITDGTMEDYIKETIIEKLSKSLKVDSNMIDEDEAFADYGLDSILGVHLVQDINQTLNIMLETTDIFDYSSVNQLSAYILSKYKDILESMLKTRPAANQGYNTINQQKLEDHVKEIIIEKLSKSLKVDSNMIDEDESFADYGLDSILGVHMVQELNQALMIKLETTDIFDYSSVNRLSAFILKKYGETINGALEQTQDAKQDIKQNEEQVIKQYVEPVKTEEHTVRDNKEKQKAKRPYLKRNAPLSVRIAGEKDSTFQEKEPIAVIGMSGRFAKSATVNELWQHLANGSELVEDISRWDISGYFPEGKKYCNRGGFLDDIDKFDPMFFSISGLEATYMDPQQRFFLEESWKALEDAGYAGQGIQGRKCGVYVGCNIGDYKELLEENPPPQAFWGNSGSVIPARIAYYLDLQGPAVAVDTACSSSLVAIHLGCQSLWNRETEIVLAGGVFIQCTPDFYVVSNRAGMLSPTGRTFAFDDRADGFVPGEGVGVLVLKRLKEAIADGDHIYGVIIGSGINQDGTTNGITAPSAKSQERLECDVYDTFNINPEQIQMIEAHGTGTKLGDPIEYSALTRAFRKYTDKKGFCSIGSVKTNVGHAATAAGVTGVIKILLSLKNGKIPPTLNFETGNTNIQFKDSPFIVNTALKEWNAESGSKRSAAISSFGFSGTNAHIVIQEPPMLERVHDEKPGYIIALSANTPEQLRVQANQLVEFCGKEPGLDCGNMSYTLLMGRKHLSHRLACVVRNTQELAELLKKWLDKGKTAQIYLSEPYENDHKEQPTLKRHGNQCIQNCRQDTGADEYMEHLSTVAHLYTQRYSLDYENLFTPGQYSRISLPTYPFARESYWVSGDNAAMEGTELNEIWEFDDNTNETAYVKINTREQEKHTGKAGTDAVISASIEHVKTLMSEIIRIPPERLDPEAHFEELGLDSIMISQLNKKVEKWIGKSDVAMFFKYNCIGELGKYFAESYPDKISLPQISGGVLNKITEQPAGLTGYTSKRVPLRSNKLPKSLPASQASESCTDTDIAVIGISGRFPKAENMEQFWKNLYEGKDCIEEIPNSRWALEGFFEPDRTRAVLEGLSYSKWGGFLRDIDCFDPLFFNITPKDAMFMDPQERLFLEVAWECMEDSGYTRRHFEQDERGNHIGVFVGASFNNYQLYMSEAALRENQKMYSANSQLFSIANRVSFVMNFTGPSLTVDTACSSSLYAVHLACDSIRSGQARMAIAGGVNLSLHPSKYIMLSQGQFSASDGRCRAFCEGGTGYVPAEAVCAVLLKPYKEAVRDRDHIYGIIKGTAANHGGKTNGYSVPNPAAQSETIEKALKRSRIHPRTISFIEAHGTGTALGDPIEMTGLTEAFRKYTEDMGFCSISSVKSNVGHAEAAAGVVQLAKVMLQLKHKTLVKNVMFGNGLNPNIDFTQTPFVVQGETEDWRRPVIDGVEVPRRAGISSFGAGGANAHIVIEEYIPENEGLEEIVTEPYNPAIIVLSARNEERLLEQVRRLLDITYERKITDNELINLAYTLQVGREAMEERLALIARTIKELQEKLKEFLESKQAFSGIYRGQVKHNKEMLSVFAADEDMSKALEAWLNKGKYSKILELWVKGMDFDWNKLYGNIRPYRISLPSYPFARERYWVPEVGTISKDNSLGQGLDTAAIHPMLHRNTSSLGEQRFSSNFTGREFFISDKRLDGQSILHGAVCLEMALAAFTESMEGLKENQEVIKLKNITWGNPVSVKDGPVQAHIGLYPGDNNEVLFEIYGRQEGDSEEPPIYSQGAALTVSNAEDMQMDIDVLKTQCKHRILTSGQCYEAFKAAGFDYGPGLKGIEQLYIGHEQVLIKLALPDSILDTVKKYKLHPTFIDSAIQVCIGMIDDFICTKTALPYTLEEMVAFGSCRPAMWALVRYSTGSKPEDRKYDIDLCDEKGTILIQLRGLLLRVSERKEIKEVQYAASGTLMLEPYWRERAVKETLQPLNAQHLIVLCELGGISPDIIKTHMGNANCIVLHSQRESVEERFRNYSLQLFEEIKKILELKPKDKVLIQVVFSANERMLFQGLSGLIKTAQAENPKMIGQLIEIDRVESADGLIGILKENSTGVIDSQVYYKARKRYVLGWSKVETSGTVDVPWKDCGVYLITGGAGGLGLIFAEDIIAKASGVTVILTGRSKLSNEKKSRIKELEAMGTRLVYRQIDVTDKEAVNNLVLSIKEEFGRLDGIIHAAGIIKDNYIIKKSGKEFLNVISPKVAGLINLDAASREIPLDFFIFFSSLAGSFGNPGQADYATANSFMDTYAGYRNNLVTAGKRHGITLSINWPLWKEGGMHVDEESEKVMMQTTGMIPLEKESGIGFLYKCLQSQKEQVVVTEGNISRIHEWVFGKNGKPRSSSQEDSAVQVDKKELKEKTLNNLKTLFGEITKLEYGRIDTDEALEVYGIDSIIIMQLNGKLSGIFTDLSKTLFYEYPTLGALNEYLTEEYSGECIKWTGLDKHAQGKDENNSKTLNNHNELPVLKPLKAGKKRFGSTSFIDAVNRQKEPVAIIGISGRFPKARNINEFWENLKSGMDCISEIPEGRWPMEGFFNPDPAIAAAHGKSYSKWGGFLDGFADFDPLFFNISPRDALNMDPQERLFIECCWEVFEDAGYTRELLLSRYNGRVGVFAGVTKTGYDLYGPDLKRQGEQITPYTSFGSVANRISYLLNLHGPSMPVDTMCSSSLTAVHEACEHLMNGECDMAVAGGVNLYLHPSNYIQLCTTGMLSRDGRCKSFGAGGNGFVPGEGAGAVLLKPLSKAIADRDNIYAVIKGTSINHGGKTNGYTVPNPVAQGELIRSALQKAGVNSRAVSYIEAHGTGTELGDPIEITGLNQAFRKDTQDTQYCAIGSVKSNIGHLEAAAGIAGIAKIVMQMKHQKLVPSLHSGEINPNIDFGKTPFKVQQELEEWKRPLASENGKAEEYPRIAGISSFGAGGANAHVIIEEYVSKDSEPYIKVTPSNPAVIVLSANNEERLTEQVQRLLDAVRRQQYPDSCLLDMAYTLQVGREAMDVRLAMLVSSLKDLEEKLEGILEGSKGMPEVYRGQVKRKKEAISIFTADEDMTKTIEAWISKKRYAKLMELWVKGVGIEWDKLYDEVKPRRISLPTYPFVREQYWVPKVKDSENKALEEASNEVIHPLVHKNTSDFTVQRYTSTFTGREFFLRDHLVKDRHVLPGVAYLEMVREAVKQAAAGLMDKQISIKNIVWVSPVIVGDQPFKVHIELTPYENGDIAFEIFSEEEGKKVIHSQGFAVPNAALALPDLDIDALKSRCDLKVVCHQDCYEMFKKMGMSYGPCLRGIQSMYIGHGKVLARLSLPDSVGNTLSQFVLHPSQLDSALQASAGLITDSGEFESHKTYLPFALQELDIYNGCTREMWAVIGYSGGLKAGDKVRKLDVDLFDEQGKACIRMKGYSSRALEDNLPVSGANEDTGSIILEPYWKEQAAVCKDPMPSYEEHLVILCEMTDDLMQIEQKMNGVCVTSINSTDGDMDERYISYVKQLFDRVRSILTNKHKGRVLIQLVIPNINEKCYLRGLSGLLRTAQLENSKLIGQVIEVEQGTKPDYISEILIKNSCRPMESMVSYRMGKRHVMDWTELPFSEKIEEIPWKDNGIYLITGGAGGLGLIFAKEIARKVNNAALVLTGRSLPDKCKEAAMNELKASGARVVYRQVDVTDRKAVCELMQNIQKDFGGINGIIHGAGVIRDNFIIRKTEEEIANVLAPKVTGLMNLDQASMDMNMDFFILFSSMAGSLGNAGQSDYSSANAFMDAYTGYRNSLVKSKRRTGLTLAVNWPLWSDGGMHTDRETENLIRQATGMVPMRTPTGISALYKAFALKKERVMVMEGDLAQMRKKFLIGHDAPQYDKYSSSALEHSSQTAAGSIRDKVQEALIKLVSDVLSIRAQDVDIDTELNEYGFDSITFTVLSNKLNKSYKLELAPTIFFECQTLGGLSKYLEEEYRRIFEQAFSVKDGEKVQGYGLAQTGEDLQLERITEFKPEKAGDLCQTIISSASEPDMEPGADNGNVKAEVHTALMKAVSEILKVRVEDIDIDTELNEYGFDSITFTGLANKLNQAYKLEINPTLFFEYPTISGISEYLFNEYRNLFSERITDKNRVNTDKKNMEIIVREKPSLKNLRTMKPAVMPLQKPDAAAHEPIAIVGISGKFPMAEDIHEFWKALEEGRDCISEVPADRWDWREYYGDPRKEVNKTNVKWGGFIDGVDEFDPLFFGISPKEALLMDPQQRLLMMYVWKAVEDAGYSAQSLSGSRTGLIVGTGNTGYIELVIKAGIPIEAYSSTGLVPSVGPNRMSYLLNIHGPSEPVETACSSSLVAIHRAVNAIQTGSCDMAIAGGINTIITPGAHISFSKAGMLCEDGRCKTFSDKANGYVRGEGVGMLFLKRLKDAEVAGDNIYAVIKGTSENHGGRANSLTAPNPKAQAQLLVDAYTNAGIDPRTVTYIEAHGTGTELGDPIEINGLKMAFKELYESTGDTRVNSAHCGLGSVKSNIGHLEFAAGAAGVIKVLLQMKHKKLFKSLHCENINPYIQLNDSPFFIVNEQMEWKAIRDSNGNEIPRRAGVSSFGFGGVNAHIVIEEYVSQKVDNVRNSALEQNKAIIVLSAKNQECLGRQAEQLLEAIVKENFTDRDLSDLAYTLQVGRDAMEERIAMVVSSINELQEKLRGFLEERDDIESLYKGQLRRNKDMLSVLEDEDMGFTVDAWIRKGKYSKIAQAWVKGLEIDWNRIYDHSKPKRISLPTYPFLKEKYWVGKSGSRQDEITGSITKTADSKDVSWNQGTKVITYKGAWEEQALEEIPDSIGDIKNKTVVCFLSDAKKRQVLENTLNAAPGTDIIYISQGTGYEKISSKRYRVSHEKADDYINALESIGSDFGKVDLILYLWPCEDKNCIAEYSNIVHILKAVSQLKLKPRRILLSGSYSSGPEACYMESWIGFEQSIRMIMPGIQVIAAFKEEDNEADTRTFEEWVNILLKELINDKPQSACYRRGKRYVYSISPFTPVRGESLLKHGGTYMVTGGSGGLGTLFSTYLAGAYGANIILTGRSAFNEEKQALIDEIRKLGGDACYIRADAADLGSMKNAVIKAKESFGNINGVIHAAGISSGKSIFEKSSEEFEEVLKPKIKGSLVLDEIFDGRDTDFICYFSSASAVMGDFGSCDYSVGNRFEAAFSSYQNTRNASQQIRLKSYSIAWPLWENGGMGLGGDENTRLYLKTSGQEFLEDKEGIRLFEDILSQEETNLYVFVGQKERVNRFPGIKNGVVDENVKQLRGTAILSGKGWNVEMKGMSLKECLEWDIKDQISRFLRIDRSRVDSEGNLADYGFDSISLSEFATTLTDHFEIEITPSVFFGHSTTKKLAKYYLKKHHDAIAEFYREDTQNTGDIYNEDEAGKAFTLKEIAASRESNDICRGLNDKDGLDGIDRAYDMHEIQREHITGLKDGAGIKSEKSEGIAIIGMSGRFPGARNIDEMWNILFEGKNVVGEIPPERFDWKEFYGDPAEEPGKINCKWCGCMPGISEFDPLFFEISPKEAELMDPRQRILLQEAWKALEDAGYGSDRINKNCTGMFVGVEDGDYHVFTGDKAAITSNHNAVLSARLSYFLNLSGPTMAINTACSSGLTAVHQACLSLLSGECDMAVAAGVSMILAKETYLSMGQAGMLSKDGICHAFDRSANGMVPGEAVAVVVLKKLSKALKNKDAIYAVIKGSGINYDGKTNGITAPNGVSQAELLKKVYDRHAINPENIEYIVTHGTGTKLGDPVEINALYDTFKDYTNKVGYCALTSNKTNFGHTLAASGIVSLINLVLAMKHEVIPASLNCRMENNYINWKESPFYVNKANRDWRDGADKVRTGAVSAFGMSGTNVHMVVNSFNEKTNNEKGHAHYYLLAFSAKKEESLKNKLNDMYSYFINTEAEMIDLYNISYTLLKGRHHFNFRCAFVVKDVKEAVDMLERAISGEKLSGRFYGKVSRDFRGQKTVAVHVEELLNRIMSSNVNIIEYGEMLSTLADAYCQGYEIDWNKLYTAFEPRIVHLPTYPFIKGSYWVENTNDKPGVNEAIDRYIHPLIHKNTSDITEQRYSSIFKGDEAFLKDHVVKGKCVLPGVAYLEMARAALKEAIPGLGTGESKNIRLKDIVWLRPITVEKEPVKVDIVLCPEDKGEISFKVYTGLTGDTNERVLHSHGNAEICLLPGKPEIDIRAVEDGCIKGTMDSQRLYEIYKQAGIEYGPSFKRIEEIYIGNEEVLAKLSIQKSHSGDGQLALIPGIMDAALQASLGLMMDSGNSDPALPFALREVEIYKDCSEAKWAVVKKSTGDTCDVRKLDIDLCDIDGTVCVRMKGFSSRVRKDAPKVHDVPVEKGKENRQTYENLLMTPIWDVIRPERIDNFPSCADRVVIIGGNSSDIDTIMQKFVNAVSVEIDPGGTIESIAERIKLHGHIDHIIWIAPNGNSEPLGDTLVEDQEKGVLQVFRIIKAMLLLGYGDLRLGWSVITVNTQPVYKGAEIKPAHAGIHGLLGSLAKEYPNWRIRLVDAEENYGSLLEEILSMPADENGDAMVCRDMEWYKQVLAPVYGLETGSSLYKENGVYVAIGGAGGIGEVWSEYMIKTYNAQIIWIGRRKEDASIKRKIERLSAFGPAPCYVSADAANLSSLEDASRYIKSKYRRINGVVHSALVLADRSLANMDERRFRSALSAKVDICACMLKVFRDEPLDLVMFFSAFQSFSKAAGQSNYAAGCTFKDAFAHQMGNELPCEVKVMNWGYWGSVGVVASKAYQERMAKSGIGSIEPPEAMEALEKLVGGPMNQVALLKTIKDCQE